MTSDARFRGGGRFALTVTDDRSGVVKEGNPIALAREARALRLLAGTGLAPRLLDHRAGRLTTALLAGRPIATADIDPRRARALGAALHRLHACRTTVTGGRHVWPSRVRSLHAYARCRLVDVGPVPRELARTRDVIARTLPARTSRAPAGFSLLHGDLVATNIVWTPQPVLVDWEFWRQGDPAEDLAYLFELNRLTTDVQHAVLVGYGDPGMDVRVDDWRAFCALDAGLWFARAGEPELAKELLERARALSAARPDA